MKKFKSIALAVTAIGLMAASQVFAQNTSKRYGADSIACVTNLSLYTEFYKQKNYKDALPHWRYVYNNCPLASQNTFIAGAKIISYKISESKDEKTRNAYIDTLMMVYESRIKYFGTHAKSSEGMVRGRQAMDLISYRPDSLKAYELLRKSVEMEGLNSDPVIVSNYYTFIDNFVSSKRFDVDSIANAYDALSDLTDEKLKLVQDDTAAVRAWYDVKSLLEVRFEPYATCTELIKIYTKKFNQTPNDTILLKKITRLLDKKDCTDSELFFMATENLHKEKPTGQSAYLMGKMYWRKGDMAKAESYMVEAVPNLDDVLKAKTFYYLGLIKYDQKSYSAARSYLLKSLAINPNDGKCYILIGDMYAASASSCGGDEISSRAAYWVAVDKYIKARNVDPTVADDANKKIATYSSYFPKVERLFFNEVKEGSSYTVGCWIGESTTVRASR